MTDQRALDRAIDVAARDMMAGEPGRRLSSNVMARIREDAPPARRWMLWAVTAASFGLCVVIATVWTIRVPTVMVSLPPAMQLPVARGATVPVVPGEPSGDVMRAPFDASASAKGPRSSVPLPPTDVSPIAVIEMRAIAMMEIDVPQLERAVIPIEVIDIQPLTIEPLAASND